MSMSNSPNTWKNRITGYGTKPADQFTAHPSNPRKHPQNQRDAVRGSLNALGWVAPVLENTRTGYLLDGHERVWQALQNGNAEVPVIYVDLDPAEEPLFLASFDYITQMAQYDREILDSLMRDIQTDEAGLQAMLAEMAEAENMILATPPEDFPEYDDEIETEYCCPKCGYEWSGAPR